MISDAKCKSFKILIVVLGLIGSTLVANCQADRIPVSLESSMKQSFCPELVNANMTVKLEAFKRSRLRNEKRWNEVKKFVGQQTTAASNKLAGLGLSDWWQQRVSPSKSPIVRQNVAGDDSIAISPMAMMVKLAGNMSAIQWWQVTSQTARLLEATQQRVAQTSTQLQVDFETSLLQLAKTSSNHLGQKVHALAASGFAQGISTGSDQLTSKPVPATANVNEAAADPYWTYYSDCDFWDVNFNQADEE